MLSNSMWTFHTSISFSAAMDMLCIKSTWNCRPHRYVPVDIRQIVPITQIPAGETYADHADHTDPTEANVWSDLQIVQIPSRK